MECHDYQLIKYAVSDRGETITLYLVYEYPDCEKRESIITFYGVVLSQFTHTSPAIITNIQQLSADELVRECGNSLESLNRLHGIRYWKSDLENFKEQLESKACSAWTIESAIGFHALIIAKEMVGS